MARLFNTFRLIRPTDHRRWIWGSFIGSGLMLLLTVFACLMQTLLASLGDELGARVAEVIALIMGASFLAGQFLLVTLLALDAVENNMDGSSSSSGTTPS